jgi:hypothetical protein
MVLANLELGHHSGGWHALPVPDPPDYGRGRTDTGGEDGGPVPTALVARTTQVTVAQQPAWSANGSYVLGKSAATSSGASMDRKRLR